MVNSNPVMRKKQEYDCNFFKNVTPIKLTECRSLQMNSMCWSLLSDFYLESVKINNYKFKQVCSVATLRVADVSGQVTCVVKGPTIGLLFGLSSEEWSSVEKMCNSGQQLFYRHFKDGLSTNFNCEQKLFYNFCHSNRKENVLTALFCRCPNTRNKDKNDALVHISELRVCNSVIFDIYLSHIRNAT